MGGVLYEALAVAALWLLASALVTILFGKATSGLPRLLLQGTSTIVIAGYFLWCWTHGGQTLAMKTWRIRLVDASGGAVSSAVALRRLILAALGIGLAGVGLWWALVDRDGRFLHDRLAGTRLVMKQP
jgi:uncharacterized RDD family membrane protein YckC